MGQSRLGPGREPTFGLRQHDPATDGIKDLGGKGLARGIERGEAQAVRMPGQPLAGAFPQVGARIEANRVRAGERQRTTRHHPLMEGGDYVGVEVDRVMALQSAEQRPIGAVAPAGQCQGAVKVDVDGADRSEQPLVTKLADEAPRRLHRTHGVRGRRADATTEQVEDGDLDHAVSLEAWPATQTAGR